MKEHVQILHDLQRERKGSPQLEGKRKKKSGRGLADQGGERIEEKFEGVMRGI